MRICRTAIPALGLAPIIGCLCTDAQAQPSRLALRNGETIEIGTVYYVSNCRSIMIGLPEIEILEGPAEVSFAIKAEDVVPRRFGCAGKVPGGKLTLTARGITERTEANLIYRLKYKTKEGDRQTSNAYIVSLFP